MFQKPLASVNAPKVFIKQFQYLVQIVIVNNVILIAFTAQGLLKMSALLVKILIFLKGKIKII
jgi:hypothetical protein